MAGAFGGGATLLKPEDKALYHLAAVLVGNYTVTLMELASNLWTSFGQDKDEAARALIPLLKSVAQNLETQGI